jgi:hypothetical protein
MQVRDQRELLKARYRPRGRSLVCSAEDRGNHERLMPEPPGVGNPSAPGVRPPGAESAYGFGNALEYGVEPAGGPSPLAPT